MRSHAIRALAIYAVVLTILAAWFAILQRRPATGSLDVLNVHRINVREPDGTLRMIVSNRASFPGLIVRNVDNPHAAGRDSAGMIFLNDEGTENGGLIFGGRKANGKVSSYGHLSFDQYEQDQVASLEQTEDNGQRKSGLAINDMPDAPIDLAASARILGLPEPQRSDEIARLRAAGVFGNRRLFIGKDVSRDALLELHDAAGRARLRLKVTPAGDAEIQFVDATGRVTRTVAP